MKINTQRFTKITTWLFVIAVVSLTSLSIPVFQSQTAQAAANFCANTPYVSIAVGGGTQLNRLGLSDGSLTPIGPLLTGIIYNAMDYNPDDGLLYTFRSTVQNSLLLINPTTGLIVNTIPVAGLPVGQNAASINSSGTRYYTKSSTDDLHIREINVDNSSSNYGDIVQVLTLSAPFAVGDFVIHPLDNKAYGLTLAGDVLRADLATGTVTTVTTISPSHNFGGQVIDTLGNMYLYSNDTGEIFKLDLTQLDGGGNVAAGTYVKISDGGNISTNVDAGGCLQSFDFGDAPNSYGTLESSNGPSHRIVSTLRLGPTVTAEPDADMLNTLNYTNDAADNGVASVPALSSTMSSYQVTASVVNTSGSTVTLGGWVDFNGNGTFETSERATAAVPNGATTATLAWSNVSPTMGPSALRLRLFGSTVANPQPVGTDSIGGEVEDYALQITDIAVPVDTPAALTLSNTGQNTLLPLIAAIALIVGAIGTKIIYDVRSSLSVRRR